jgi:hypothetical protein
MYFKEVRERREYETRGITKFKYGIVNLISDHNLKPWYNYSAATEYINVLPMKLLSACNLQITI